MGCPGFVQTLSYFFVEHLVVYKCSVDFKNRQDLKFKFCKVL